MKPFSVVVSQYGKEDELTGNIRYSLSLGLPEFAPIFFQHDGTLILVGSGPSLPIFINEIKEEYNQGRTIVAMNGAHDYLIENGITPDIFLTVDPRPMPQNLKFVNKQTTYLIASRCGKETFEALKEKKVILWHAWGDPYENKLLEGKFVVTGGTTSGLRAFNIGYLYGFRKFKGYGMDSCFHGNIKRCDGIIGEKMPKIIDITVGEKTYYTNYAMAAQAHEFQNLYQVFPDISIEMKGDGLLAGILTERRKTGLKC